MKYYDLIDSELQESFTDKHYDTGLLAEVFKRNGYLDIYNRLMMCGTALEFAVASSDAEDPRLVSANFCKHRLCPMCSWRRSLKIYGQVSQIMDHIGEEYRYLFIMLSVKNCRHDELRQVIDKMNYALTYKFNRNKHIKRVFLGFIKSIEITYNRDLDNFHPHIHLLVAVRPSYFTSRDYITKAMLQSFWRDACGLTYDPIVYVQKVKPSVDELDSVSYAKAVCEVAKYSIKSADILAGDDRTQDARLLAFLSLSGMRFFSMSGIFSIVRKQLDLDDVIDGDLINTDNQRIRSDVYDLIVCYKWLPGIGYMVRNVRKREI